MARGGGKPPRCLTCPLGFSAPSALPGRATTSPRTQPPDPVSGSDGPQASPARVHPLPVRGSWNWLQAKLLNTQPGGGPASSCWAWAGRGPLTAPPTPPKALPAPSHQNSPPRAFGESQQLRKAPSPAPGRPPPQAPSPPLLWPPQPAAGQSQTSGPGRVLTCLPVHLLSSRALGSGLWQPGPELLPAALPASVPLPPALPG